MHPHMTQSIDLVNAAIYPCLSKCGGSHVKSDFPPLFALLVLSCSFFMIIRQEVQLIPLGHE